MDYNTTNNAK